MQFHRGRLVDHIHLIVPDLALMKRFYAAILNALGIGISGEGPGYFFTDELYVSEPRLPDELPTGRHHIAFQALDRDMVDRFYDAGLAAGGRSHGEPGFRKQYHPGYYAAFLIDPAGNNIEAVFHGLAMRSAPSVVIVPHAAAAPAG
jgi:Glyoxalase/Bleomycin resistance protein/Dioxygenase superfamily.